MATIRKTPEKKEQKTFIIANEEKSIKKNTNKKELKVSEIVEKKKRSANKKQTTEKDSVKTEKVDKTVAKKQHLPENL